MLVLAQEQTRPGGFLAKFSTEGQHRWSRAIKNSGVWAVAGHAVATDTAGNVLLGGNARSPSPAKARSRIWAVAR